MRKLSGSVLVLAGLLASCGGTPQAEISVVSSKPYLVSGGDALVRVSATSEGSLAGISITLDGADISGSFRPDGESLLGHVGGMDVGTHVLEAGGAQLEITNFPASGPMISGPHEQPFVCGTTEIDVALTGESLDEPLNGNCSAPTRVDYVYYSTDGEFKPWPGERPSDIAETTTMDGATVPFTVRVETGTINRGIYQSAILHAPSEPEPSPWVRSEGWNGKLVYTHGGGCQRGWHVQGNSVSGVLNEGLLGDGYATTSSSLNIYGNNCNDLIASETHMMVKERFIEAYGEPVYTIGTGGSGGSYQSHQTADNYPGVFDGIIVTASFPDVISATIPTVSDVRLLRYSSKGQLQVHSRKSSNARCRALANGRISRA